MFTNLKLLPNVKSFMEDQKTKLYISGIQFCFKNMKENEIGKITHCSKQTNDERQKTILKISGFFLIQLNLLTHSSYQFQYIIKLTHKNPCKDK